MNNKEIYNQNIELMYIVDNDGFLELLLKTLSYINHNCVSD